MPSPAIALHIERKESVALDQTTLCSRNARSSRSSLIPQLLVPSGSGSDAAEPANPGTDLDTTRKAFTSYSDSGTEADDEKDSSLTFLPPPPLRPRKGLKEGYETPSPLTPSYLDDTLRRSALEEETRRRSHCKSDESADDEIAQIREKFRKRRRAELIRRATETCLLGAIGAVSVSLWLRHVTTGLTRKHTHQIGSPYNGVHVPAFVNFAVLLGGIYTSYPLRIIYNNHRRNRIQGKAWYHIHIPAAFDPAPLIYPTIVPCLVFMSLRQASTAQLPLSLSLGLASIPSKIIPFSDGTPWYHSPHWLISAIPILISRNFVSVDQVIHRIRDAGSQLPGENQVCVYLLHQALMSILGYYTTTSLLPAELQLLSSSLISLFLLAQSPQAVILKALLWIGGLIILLLCSKVLSWEVSLARVPSWRFYRPQLKARPRRRIPIAKALDDCLGGRLSCWGMISDPETSDSDESLLLQPAPFNPGKTTSLIVEPSASRSPELRVDRNTTGPSPPADLKPSEACKIDASTDAYSFRVQRRFTLPSSLDRPERPKRGNEFTKTTRAKNRTGGNQIWSFRSLTASQAVILKWAFALYTYAVTLAVILLPIRLYVSRHALGAREPFGWAVGYLFGDTQWAKRLSETLGFYAWIPWPAPTVGNTAIQAITRADHCAQMIGPSNIRLLICLYCIAIIATGLLTVLRLSAVVEVDTRRKIFHGMMVGMFLPTIFIDPPFVCLALMLVLSIFLLLDLFRASQVPPLSKPLTYFLAPYVDGRDHRGPVIVSHIFLLIGCAIPLWLSLAGQPRTRDSPWPGWEVPRRDVGMVSGVVCVGMGDAAASLIGRRYGRRRWPWSGGKSLEGSLAFAIAVVAGLIGARSWLLFGGWPGDSGDPWTITMGKATVAACGASLTEAVLTGGNDNVIVPVILWLLVTGLEI